MKITLTLCCLLYFTANAQTPLRLKLTEIARIFGFADKDIFLCFGSKKLEDKIKYVDRIKIMLEDLAEKVKISHGDFNLDNIMVDEDDNLKLVDFGKGCAILDDDSKKNIDTENFNNCNFYLDTITEQVTYDLQNYWYEIMK